MSLVSMKEILDKAYNNQYAVGAFNVVNLEFLEAIIETAEHKSSPIILNLAEVHFPYINLENFCPTIISMSKKSAVPIALNLDHGMSYESAVRVIQHGFTSVMYDGSKQSFGENASHTAEIVKLCHSAGLSVEAELGAVGGDEGGGLESEANSEYFTNPDQAKIFVEQTGIDALAVAIGNSHGKYKGEPKLDFNLLEQINKSVQIPLVLHGGSGISEKDFKKAISLGIAKINIYTDMSQAALNATEKFMQNIDGKYHAFPELMQSIKSTVKDTVAQQIDIVGSANKA